MAMFKAFKPSGMEKIARAMGYQGNMQGFQDYLAQDPMRQQKMQDYQEKAMQMARGGVVRMQTGGSVQQANTPNAPTTTTVKQLVKLLYSVCTHRVFPQELQHKRLQQLMTQHRIFLQEQV
jgi:hypothetical protein